MTTYDRYTFRRIGLGFVLKLVRWLSEAVDTMKLSRNRRARRPIVQGRNRVLKQSLVFALCGGLIGCGGSDWGYVKGVVTLEGQPVGPGVLIFDPVGPDRRSEPSSTGHLNAQGEYTLMSAGKKKGKDGAPVGEYSVTIMGGDSSSISEEMTTQAEATSLIPARYQSPEAGLTASVAAGNQTINFELKKQNNRRRR